ncbi:restriction endonuclease subunit S [Streptomyces sp. R39]|uniref:Restriction endonuclease subunit S n=1 Tax=Streptomyces sp. R39 TaxID=3238631 RepID=A0AB39QVJ3_9ACTN
MTTDSGVGPGGAGSGGDVTDAGGLPAGWGRATLGELGEWFGGGTPSKKNPEFWTDGTIPWLSPKDMGEAVLSGTQDLINESALDASPVKWLPAGAVAIVVRSGILERKVPVAYVPFKVTLNQDMKAVVPHEGIDGRWLAFIISSQEQRILADCRKSGTTVASLEVSRLMELEVSVPPVAEQHRIVAKLDEQLAHIEAGEAAVEAASAKQQPLMDSILDRCVLGLAYEPSKESLKDIQSRSGRKINYQSLRALPAGWVWRAAQDVCSSIVSGSTPEASLMHADAGDIPFLKVYNISKRGFVDFTVRPTFVDRETHEKILKRSKVLPGDVLTNIVGPPLGKSAVVPEGHPEWNINQAIAAFRAGPEISPEWLRFVLQSPYVIGILVRTARATAGQFNIAISTCRELPIPIPPRRVQDALCKELAESTEQLAVLHENVHSLNGEALELREALFHAAFTGALVPQDPDDEPASVLLDRIRAERATVVKQTRRKRVSHTTSPAAPQTSGRPVPSGTQEALPL